MDERLGLGVIRPTSQRHWIVDDRLRQVGPGEGNHRHPLRTSDAGESDKSAGFTAFMLPYCHAHIAASAYAADTSRECRKEKEVAQKKMHVSCMLHRPVKPPSHLT